MKERTWSIFKRRHIMKTWARVHPGITGGDAESLEIMVEESAEPTMIRNVMISAWSLEPDELVILHDETEKYLDRLGKFEAGYLQQVVADIASALCEVRNQRRQQEAQ